MEENQNVEVENENKPESKGFSVTAMVLGIISIVLFCVAYISIPCAILAIIFGIIGRKRGGKGMGTTGLVLGIVSIAIVIILFLLGASLVGIMGSTLENAARNANVSIY